MRVTISGLLGVLAGASLVCTLACAQSLDATQFAGLKWRNIGPFRGGRVSAVAGSVSEPDTFYMGLPFGGIWKTTSAGQVWYPVFDAVKETSTVGAIEVAPSDPNIVYAGTGDISTTLAGAGAYKSSDAGKTWTHIGLDGTIIIPTVLVDPHDPNLVLAAAMGTVFRSSGVRGIFRSTDGGKTWTDPLSAKNDVGIQNMAWAPDNPKVIIATGVWQFGGSSRGPALYKSTDEGLTWTKLDAKGLPEASGRMTLAVALGTNSQRMYLIGTFGLYRSDDGGQTWRKMASDDSRIANGQGYYSSGVYVDPKNPDLVYTLATCVYRSTDGGNTFQGFKGAPGGDDPQHMWIDPNNGNHILLGGDQGATVSLDAGKTWGSWYNQATGQLYHISVNNQFPYWVYGTQQDSGCIAVASRGSLGQITQFDWFPQPGNEGGHIVVNPLDSKVTYAVGPIGGIVRVTFPSGESVQVEPTMNPNSGLRGGGDLICFSPANPHELLLAYQYLLSSTDAGAHWNKLGPDLTVPPTAKKGEQNQSYATIRSYSASPIASGVIWAGTSNGLLRLTKDHGKTWSYVTIPDQLHEGKRLAVVNLVEASGADAASAYVVCRSGQPPSGKTHVLRTHDLGVTWSECSNGLPSDAVAVIQSDSKRKGLLFALTSSAVYVTLNDGDNWEPLTLNLPTTQLSDLVIHGSDLVLSTYGRGIWILDDYSPLRELSLATANDTAHLFKPADAYRLRRNINQDTPLPPDLPHAENPPLGAVIYYSLKTKPSGEVRLDVVDAKGNVVRHMSSAPVPPYDDPAPPVAEYWPEVRKAMPTDLGLNRINWNIRCDTPPAFVHDLGDVMGAVSGDTPEAIEGPLVLPGVYTARLIVDGRTYSQSFTVKNDPRSPATLHDLTLENELRMSVVAGVVEAWDGYHQVESLRKAVSDVLAAKPPAAVTKAAEAFDHDLGEAGGTLRRGRRFYGPPPATSFVNLNGYLLARLDSWDYGDAAPTEPMLAVYASDWQKLKAVADRWRALQSKGLADFNAVLRKNGIAPIAWSTRGLEDPPAPEKRFMPKPEPKRKVAPTKLQN